MATNMLASDAANPEFLGAQNPDSALAVRFHRRPVHQPFKSKEEGRPVFMDVDFIEIYTPGGGNLNIVDTPVREDHKRRFPVQWAAFQNAHAGDQREIGTPLSAWPMITASIAEELKAQKFFTVEQVANASDLQISSIGMSGGMAPSALRARAQAYLAAAAGTAPSEAQAQELAETKAQLAALQKQMSDFMALQSGLTPVAAPEKPKRKRRTKEEIRAAQSQPAPEMQPSTDAL